MSEAVTRAKPRRRKNPQERADEIVETASILAVSEGLEAVTAKRVASALGVYPGLVNHYFPAIDDLIAAAFTLAASRERAEVYAVVTGSTGARQRVLAVIASYTSTERDAISLLWMDAWQASRRRPALKRAVGDQMTNDFESLAEVIAVGVESGELSVADPRAAAMSILALVDGLSIQAAVRERLDYATVTADFIVAARALVGLSAD